MAPLDLDPATATVVEEPRTLLLLGRIDESAAMIPTIPAALSCTLSELVVFVCIYQRLSCCAAILNCANSNGPMGLRPQPCGYRRLLIDDLGQKGITNIYLIILMPSG